MQIYSGHIKLQNKAMANSKWLTEHVNKITSELSKETHPEMKNSTFLCRYQLKWHSWWRICKENRITHILRHFNSHFPTSGRQCAIFYDILRQVCFMENMCHMLKQTDMTNVNRCPDWSIYENNLVLENTIMKVKVIILDGNNYTMLA